MEFRNWYEQDVAIMPDQQTAIQKSLNDITDHYQQLDDNAKGKFLHQLESWLKYGDHCEICSALKLNYLEHLRTNKNVRNKFLNLIHQLRLAQFSQGWNSSPATHINQPSQGDISTVQMHTALTPTQPYTPLDNV